MIDLIGKIVVIFHLLSICYSTHYGII